MNRRDLVKAVAAHVDVDPKIVAQVVQGMTEVTTAAVAKGETVSIAGFAKFAKVQRAARMGRNPATGQPIKIKASTKVRITPLKGFKDAVMKPSTAPKLARGILNADGSLAAAAAPAKKVAVKKSAPAKAATKSTAKAPAKKAPAKKAPAKKTAAAKAPAKKAPAKKAPAKKAPAKRTAKR